MVRGSQRRSAFSRVEIAVIVVVCGMLGAFAVPRFLERFERSRAADAFNYLARVQSAEERHHARHGTYTGSTSALDLVGVPPEHFIVGQIAPGSTGDISTSWRQTLKRSGPAPGYGAYTVTFNQEGFEAAASTVDPELRTIPARE